MENTPKAVGQKFCELSARHGVVMQGSETAFTLSGLIDHIYNLRAEVDAFFLRTVPQKSTEPTGNPAPQPVHASRPMVSPGSHVGPPPGMPAHIFRSFTHPTVSSHATPPAHPHDPKFDPTMPLSPSRLAVGLPGTSPGQPTSSGAPNPAATTAAVPSSVPMSFPDPSTLTTGGHMTGPTSPAGGHIPMSFPAPSTLTTGGHKAGPTSPAGGHIPRSFPDASSLTTGGDMTGPTSLPDTSTPTAGGHLAGPTSLPDTSTPTAGGHLAGPTSLPDTSTPTAGGHLAGPTSLPDTSTPTAGGHKDDPLHKATPPTADDHHPDSESFSTPPSSPPHDQPGSMLGHKPDDPSIHDRERDPAVGKPGPSAPDGGATKSEGTPVDPRSPSPPAGDDISAEKMPNVFTGLNPDALALVRRLPEGNIHGIEYNIREGSVCINLKEETEVDEAITKFQDAFKRVIGHGHRLRVEQVEIPAARSKEEVEAEIARFEHKYLHTAFVLDEEKRVVRVISQNRQFDQAKKFLEDALGQSSAPGAGEDSMVVRFAQNRTLTLKRGDIVREKADVLVNAANSRLLHGGGVAGALNAASEGQLQNYCNKYMEKKRRGKEIPVGEVAVTHGGGKLRCSRVIHAVGPHSVDHSSVQCEHLLQQVIRNTLKAGETNNGTSIVIPAISCGIFGVSKELVAQCIIDTILSFNYTKPAPVLSDIRIVILDGPTHSCFAHYLKQKVQPSKGACGSTTHLHKPKHSRNAEEKTKPVEGELDTCVSCPKVLWLPTGMILCRDDINWLMPLLSHAAPKWKEILTSIGITNDHIMTMMESGKDGAMLLQMGMKRWVKQASATLGALVAALRSPEVGEGYLASEIVKGKFNR